jgi:hypothetical protein
MFWTEWLQALPEFNPALTSLWMQINFDLLLSFPDILT